MALISERVTCSSFYVTTFLIGPLLRVPPHSIGGGETGLWKTYTYIIKRWLVVSFGGVADRERKHPGDEASGMRGARGKHPDGEASGIRGVRGKHPNNEASGIRGARGKHPR